MDHRMPNAHSTTDDTSPTSPLVSVDGESWDEISAPDPEHKTDAQRIAMIDRLVEAQASWAPIQAQFQNTQLNEEARLRIAKITGRKVIEDPDYSPDQLPVDPATSSHPADSIESADQIHALQIRLATLSSCLADIIHSTAPSLLSPKGSSSPDDGQKVASKLDDQKPDLASLVIQNRIDWSKHRNVELEKENMILRRAIKIQGTAIAQLQKDLSHTKGFAPTSTKQFRGVDPSPISDLASELVCGSRNAGDIAAALFDLVEASDWAKEDSHPIVRLDSAEAILDVMLGRVAELERRAESLHRDNQKILVEVNKDVKQPKVDTRFMLDEEDFEAGIESSDSGGEDDIERGQGCAESMGKRTMTLHTRDEEDKAITTHEPTEKSQLTVPKPGLETIGDDGGAARSEMSDDSLSDRGRYMMMACD